MDTKLFAACRVHNNDACVVVGPLTWDDGVNTIIQWCREMQFDITDNQIQDINNLGIFQNDDDTDNIFTFSIAVLEKPYQHQAA